MFERKDVKLIGCDSLQRIVLYQHSFVILLVKYRIIFVDNITLSKRQMCNSLLAKHILPYINFFVIFFYSGNSLLCLRWGDEGRVWDPPRTDLLPKPCRSLPRQSEGRIGGFWSFPSHTPRLRFIPGLYIYVVFVLNLNLSQNKMTQLFLIILVI